ncbi:MAG: WG repeat-containing protein [Saprospiraceae bacterium]|nr:WG repeat-containing protein [Saprospiraceae bacterium]
MKIKVIITVVFLISVAYGYSQQLNSYKDNNGKFGYKNNSGEIVVKPIYDYASNLFYDGLAVVMLGDKYGFIDTVGVEVIPLIYDYVNAFDEGLAIVNLDSSWGIIDVNGIVKIPFEYDYLDPNYFDYERILIFKGVVGKYNNPVKGKYGVADFNGKELIPCIYDSIGVFSSNMAAVKKDGRWGYVNEKGDLVIPIQYSYAGEFDYDEALVNKLGLWGIINKKGKLESPFTENHNLDSVYGYFPDYQNDNLLKLDSATYIRRFSSKFGSYGVYYGFDMLKKNNFSNYFSDNYSLDFGQNLYSVSFEACRKFNYLEDNYMEFKYYLPTTVSPYDTLKYTLNGFLFEQGIYRGLNLLYMSEKVDCPISLSYSVGSFYLKENNTKLRNPFFLVSLRLNPKVVLFKRLVVGGIVKYNWDLSKPGWKSDENYLIENLNYKNTSMSFQIGLLWVIFYQSSYVRIYN